MPKGRKAMNRPVQRHPGAGGSMGSRQWSWLAAKHPIQVEIARAKALSIGRVVVLTHQVSLLVSVQLLYGKGPDGL
jgi:hypothetical protein